MFLQDLISWQNIIELDKLVNHLILFRKEKKLNHFSLKILKNMIKKKSFYLFRKLRILFFISELLADMN